MSKRAIEFTLEVASSINVAINQSEFHMLPIHPLNANQLFRKDKDLSTPGKYIDICEDCGIYDLGMYDLFS